MPARPPLPITSRTTRRLPRHRWPWRARLSARRARRLATPAIWAKASAPIQSSRIRRRGLQQGICPAIGHHLASQAERPWASGDTLQDVRRETLVHPVDPAPIRQARALQDEACPDARANVLTPSLHLWHMWTIPSNLSTDVTGFVIMQTLMTAILPPEGEGLGRYLDAVTSAVGLRTDADLARLIGVQPSIIASWRRRQTVTRSGAAWLEDNLIKVIAERKTCHFTMDSEEMAVMEVLRRTNVDPLNLGPDNLMAAEAVPPLVSIARIILNGHLAHELDKDENREIRLADLLMEALPSLRKRLAPKAPLLTEGPQ